MHVSTNYCNRHKLRMLCPCFTGGVTNTAQYQNRLMVYDPEQVTLK